MKALILTYLLSYGGAFVALFQPFYGVCAYVSLAILKPTHTWQWTVPDGPYAQMVAIALIGGWGLRRFGSWKFGKATPIVFCFAAFVGWSTLSMFLVAKNELLAVNFVVLMVKIFLPFLIAMTLIDSVERLKVLAWVIVLTMGLVAFEENVYYLAMGHVPGMNGIAHEMAAGVGLAVFLGIFSVKTWQKWLCWLVALLLAHVPLIHMSRGAMIGLIITGVAIAYSMPKNRQTISVALIALIVAVFLVGPSVTQEFSTIFAAEELRDASAQSRLDLWADMFSVALSNPVFGIGPANWPTVAHEFGWATGKQGHGLWLQLIAELGFVGGGLILGFYLICVIRLLRISNHYKATNSWLMAPILGVPASLLCWLVEAQFGSFWSIETPFYIVLLGASTLRVISIDLPRRQAQKMGGISQIDEKSVS